MTLVSFWTASVFFPPLKNASFHKIHNKRMAIIKVSVHSRKVLSPTNSSKLSEKLQKLVTIKLVLVDVIDVNIQFFTGTKTKHVLYLK